MIQTAPNASGSTPPIRDGARPRDARWQMRLVVSIPALLVVFTLAFGVISYLSFSQAWDELRRAGALEIGSRLLRTHLVAMLALTGLALTAGLTLSWSILRPLRAMTRAARQIADGRLDSPAPRMPATPELEEFHQTFNWMIARLTRTIAERNRGLVEGIPMGILTTDMEGRINALNPVAASLLGVTHEAVVGRTIGELGRNATGLARAIMNHLGRKLADEQSFTGHEFAVSGAAGDCSLIISAALMRDSRQEPLGMVFHLRESSQVHNLSTHLSQTDQLALLGTFALGMAHQLRNPLGAVKGLSQLLATRPDLPGDYAPYLERMGREIDRADVVVAQLLDLAQPATILAQPADIAEIITGAIDQARQGLPDSQIEAIELLTDLAPLPATPVQASRLCDAFSQILRNAYQFTPAGGRIRVSTRALNGRPHAPGRPPHWEVRIENTGPALAPGEPERLFEPFYTTRPHATGLGLTIARQIVIQNGGVLRAHNTRDGVAFIATFTPGGTGLNEPGGGAGEGGR